MGLKYFIENSKGEWLTSDRQITRHPSKALTFDDATTASNYIDLFVEVAEEDDDYFEEDHTDFKVTEHEFIEV